ncbi:hypothetical protein [Mycobacteroides abscessus]|uniref:hypothetical protein n=1 Tax=Mycobacteroides abscessus TaxID=36809 RepID=UPI00092CA046|nr:hypothetical protein [Mycobacteroides abscessus]SII55198.1 Uncharacterised protein [Mycobacteroides abscessus subsp. abscessus]
MPSPTDDFTRLTDPAVERALRAWQRADSTSWLDAFVDQPGLTDDGALRDFGAFSAEIGNEYFTSIEKVSPDGHTVTSQFHSETWGNFRTFFRFVPDESGKFRQLDIGQA